MKTLPQFMIDLVVSLAKAGVSFTVGVNEKHDYFYLYVDGKLVTEGRGVLLHNS